ncbi:hypothetical protein [Roseateles sp.]|uniref:hypothetical protein n=1 Tax=Roseateles sp. TaxID=1971397 RepID=UPI003266F0B5
MKSLASALALALTLGVGAAPGSTPAADAAPAQSQVDVVGSVFGLFKLRSDGTALFEPATVVPLVQGQAYGWMLKLRTDAKQVRWREEFMLPAAPEVWNGAASVPADAGVKHTLSADSRVSIMERVVAPEGGVLMNSWAVEKGDPAGTYRIRVFVEGRLAASFEFDVR